jgi:uncharacterized protein YbcV (DUF1398 family)
MDTKVIADCMKQSFADTPFSKIIPQLASAGVQSYTADLMKLRNTYYDAGRKAFDEVLLLEDAPVVAPAFDSTTVSATVKSIQRGEIGYADFLRRIMNAGCSHYEVYIAGRKAMYFGRDGDFYTEPFPAPAK